MKAKAISLNVGKAELELFTSLKKQFDFDLKIKLNGKKLYEIDSLKYLEIQIEKRLTWKQQINHLALNLNKANTLLSKLRQVFDIKTLRSVCYVSPIYALLHLFRCKTLIQLKGFVYYRKNTSESKSLFFQSRNSHTGSLFKVSNILNSFDKKALENCIFISKSLKGLSPSVVNSLFNFFLSHTLMTPDDQMLVILKDPLTILKSMVNI